MEYRQLMSTVDSRKNRIVKSATVFELVDFSRHTSEPEWSAPLLKTSKQSFKLLAMEEFQRERNWQKEKVRRKPPQDDSRTRRVGEVGAGRKRIYVWYTHTGAYMKSHYPASPRDDRGVERGRRKLSIKEKRAHKGESEKRRRGVQWGGEYEGLVFICAKGMTYWILVTQSHSVLKHVSAHLYSLFRLLNTVALIMLFFTT